MPPLTIENASALVGGIPPKETDMKQPGTQSATVKVKVLRSFQDHRRAVLAKGSEAELPRLFALEMQAANKVQILAEPVTEPAVAAPTEEKSKGDDGKKGARNAR